MEILALSLNHKKASVDLREQVAFDVDALRPALRDLTTNHGISEAAILSTCNRTEIYCQQSGDNSQQILNWLSQHRGISRSQLDDKIICFSKEKAVKHAFRVASGLESAVIGEPQILGQMKSAFNVAVDAGATGKVLNRFFQHTFAVAKRVRTDTSIGTNSVSVAYTGVCLAKQVFEQLAEQTVLLIGAGETIELVARHFHESGVKQITIANRSMDKAKVIADTVGGQAITLEQIHEQLPHVDIVVSSTASRLPILGKGAVEHALEKRGNKPMFILDLAVPRDVEAEVERLQSVHLYSIDDLNSVVQQNQELRELAVEEAKIMIDLQVVRFMRWMKSLDALPLIRTLRQELNRIQQEEANEAIRRIRNGEDPKAVVQQLARILTNKFAHLPSQALTNANIDGTPELVTAVQKIFDL